MTRTAETRADLGLQLTHDLNKETITGEMDLNATRRGSVPSSGAPNARRGTRGSRDDLPRPPRRDGDRRSEAERFAKAKRTSRSMRTVVSEGLLERRILPSRPVPLSPYTCRSEAVLVRSLYHGVISGTGPNHPVSRTFADKVMRSPRVCRHRAASGPGCVGRRRTPPPRNTIARPLAHSPIRHLDSSSPLVTRRPGRPVARRGRVTTPPAARRLPTDPT